MTGYDVVVVSATAAGVCTAVAAAGVRASVALLEAGRHAGGMTSGGLGYTDLGDPRVLGGLGRRFRDDVGAHYGVAPGTHAGPEPHVAEQILLRWLEQAGVALFLGHPLDGVERADSRVTAVHAGGSVLEASVVVDATYEGDLLAAAGAS